VLAIAPVAEEAQPARANPQTGQTIEIKMSEPISQESNE